MLDKLSPSVGRFDALKFKLYSDHAGERIRRDRSHTFYEWDPKGGYYKGSTGTFRDYIDPEITTKQSIGIALEEGKRQWKLFKEDINYYYGWKDRDPECVDGVDFDVPLLSSPQSTMQLSKNKKLSVQRRYTCVVRIPHIDTYDK